VFCLDLLWLPTPEACRLSLTKVVSEDILFGWGLLFRSILHWLLILLVTYVSSSHIDSGTLLHEISLHLFPLSQETRFHLEHKKGLGALPEQGVLILDPGQRTHAFFVVIENPHSLTQGSTCPPRLPLEREVLRGNESVVTNEERRASCRATTFWSRDKALRFAGLLGRCARAHVRTHAHTRTHVAQGRGHVAHPQRREGGGSRATLRGDTLSSSWRQPSCPCLGLWACECVWEEGLLTAAPPGGTMGGMCVFALAAVSLPKYQEWLAGVSCVSWTLGSVPTQSLSGLST